MMGNTKFKDVAELGSVRSWVDGILPVCAKFIPIFIEFLACQELLRNKQDAFRVAAPC